MVTLDSLQGYTIEDYGYQLGRYWGIGQKGKNTGALLIVAPKEHKVRIEVGYGLEGTLTDAISATIIQNYILPSFKRGDYNAGVLAGTTSILSVLGGNSLSAPPPPPQPLTFWQGPWEIVVIWALLFFGAWGYFIVLWFRHRNDPHDWTTYGGDGWSSGSSVEDLPAAAVAAASRAEADRSAAEALREAGNVQHLFTTESFFPLNGERSTLVFERRVRDQISEIPDTRRVTQLRYTSRSALLILLLLILASRALAAAPKFPTLTGRVVDDAGVLDASTQSQLTDMLAAHERATGEQVVVVTLDSLQGFSIEDYGYQLGRYWGIGQKGKNTGAILIVAPKEHKVRIEVGYGLEGTLTDADQPHDNRKRHPAKLQARRLQRRHSGRHHVDSEGARWRRECSAERSRIRHERGYEQLCTGLAAPLVRGNLVTRNNPSTPYGTDIWSTELRLLWRRRLWCWRLRRRRRWWRLLRRRRIFRRRRRIRKLVTMAESIHTRGAPAHRCRHGHDQARYVCRP